MFNTVIRQIKFHRFKQFGDDSFVLHPGVSLLGGGNNAGKSTILHGLAIWEFCRTALEMERGSESFLAGHSGQGLGLGDDEFSPINVPSLKHLWTNLKVNRVDEQDGYTLQIRCEWLREDEAGRFLEFGLSLANDRLFIKATASNLEAGDQIPRVAYLPPFAGMTDREVRTTGAIRRRRIGEGLAGAVLRNILLDMQEGNLKKRVDLRGEKTKIRRIGPRKSEGDRSMGAASAKPAHYLRFGTGCRDLQGGVPLLHPGGGRERGLQGFKLKRHPGYNKRDLMVEGSGLLQWLSVFALATDPEIDVLLLDEPDAHLHPSLQDQLLEGLRGLAETAG